MIGKVYYEQYIFGSKKKKIILDSINRKTKYNISDFKNKNEYFICSFNGSFSRIINMKLIKGLIFDPCPWKDTYKDQILWIYFNEENFLEDLEKTKKARHLYDTGIFGLDVFDFITKFKNINPELATETELIIELTKDDGRW